ncbi:MAG: hypothetical protein COA79_17855 [Planctomycetota bacterium]|nr:MAG: hypothetical protein COA79_17855 [Planctomycetota bacterium]
MINQNESLYFSTTEKFMNSIKNLNPAEKIKPIDILCGPKASLNSKSAFYTAYFLRHYLNLNVSKKIISNIENSIRKKSKSLEEGGTYPVPSYNCDKLLPKDFKEIFLKSQSPVVIKGLAKNWPCVKTWSPSFFSDHYGQEMVRTRLLASQNSSEGLEAMNIPMKDLCDDIKNDGEMQGAALEDIIVKHQSLKSHLQTDELQKYIKGHFLGKIIATQIYMSGSKARSAFHCAPGGNLFIQVYGRKKWTFVNPKHTIWMQPFRRNDMISAGSSADSRLNAAQNDENGHDLFKYIPKYEIDLEPGDVLFSPQWWWHEVDNHSPAIGVACRFLTNIFANNPAFTLTSFFDLNSIKLNIQLMSKGHGSDAILSKSLFPTK